MFKKAFTLVEVIVSLVIFAITMVGITNLLIYSKRQTGQAYSRMVEGELAKYFLDRLQMHVRQDKWDQPPPGNLLTVGKYRSPNNLDYSIADGYTDATWLEEFDRRLNPVLANVMYYSAQENSDVTGTSLRRVKLIISYPSDVYQ